MHTIKRVLNRDDLHIAGKFINEHHSYIKYAKRPARQIYWLLYEDEILVGVFALSSGFVRPLAIKKFMQENKIEFNEIGNNIVYCLYGNKDRNSGTKYLKLLRKDAILWWKEKYGDTLKAMQSFVLPPRTGAVYKADNWICLGETVGVSKSIKTIYKEEEKDDPTLEIRKFKDGHIRYLRHSKLITDKKLIFIRRV